MRRTNTTASKSNNKPKGNFIESQAVAYLLREGYEVVARNYAYHGGELDIVARDGATLVFIEVKSVWNNQEGNPAARVNSLKQKKIWQTACHFLATQKAIAPKGFDEPCRFDVLSTRAYQQPLQFAHYKNAFEGTQVIPSI
ncbi:MAG: YraN family protein [Fibrobacter sp.]|uniref:YraN family protein n=1 Tax=Fibrobacter sp. TaxID=35828 RepID=UPI0025C39703|nr:YraN family protein [Fibrobacter sp.]MBQ7080467.1 YraN family protein [Fibrobacter sp.]